MEKEDWVKERKLVHAHTFIGDVLKHFSSPANAPFSMHQISCDLLYFLDSCIIKSTVR